MISNIVTYDFILNVHDDLKPIKCMVILFGKKILHVF